MELELLNHSDVKMRLEALKKLYKNHKKIEPQQSTNNHVHTFYSFSPYSPSAAVWMAYKAGLPVVGIMDHDSISGAEEFLAAGEIVGISTTCGVELRADFSDTRLAEKRINNPDQKGIAYLALHAISRDNFKRVTEFFAPYRVERNKRNRLMTDNINNIIDDTVLHLDFDKDILPISKFVEGGSVTERHLLFALTKKLLAKTGKGIGVSAWFAGYSIVISEGIKERLTDVNNPFYEYDLLGVLKGSFAERMYLPATSECPSVSKVVDFAKQINAVLAYAYLGDVNDSVTGDKKAQKFEDSYLDMLFEELKHLNFDAVTYMPSRNTEPQLNKIRKMCDLFGFMQISGEDVNSPRQSFVCNQLNNPIYKNLVESSWQLIAHEKKEANYKRI
ncbi:MAG: PHP domain-containing protein [Clostridiaceae bacterium]|nr:PHP domain-containing protein [Clostridiaceae bacterium]